MLQCNLVHCTVHWTWLKYFFLQIVSCHTEGPQLLQMVNCRNKDTQLIGRTALLVNIRVWWTCSMLDWVCWIIYLITHSKQCGEAQAVWWCLAIQYFTQCVKWDSLGSSLGFPLGFALWKYLTADIVHQSEAGERSRNKTMQCNLILEGSLKRNMTIFNYFCNVPSGKLTFHRFNYQINLQ